MATELARGRDGDGSPNGAAHGRKHGRPRPLSCHALGGGYRAELGRRPATHLAMRHVRGRSSGRPRRSPADRITGAASLSVDRDARTAFCGRAATLAGGERHQQPQGCGSPLHRGCARRSLDRARRRRRVPPACREMRHRSKPPWISESPGAHRGPLRAPTPGFRAERHQAVCRRHHGPHGLPRARTGPRNVLEPPASPGAAPAHGTAHTRGYRWCPGRPGQPLLPAFRVSVHPDAAPQEGRCCTPDARRERRRHTQ